MLSPPLVSQSSSTMNTNMSCSSTIPVNSSLLGLYASGNDTNTPILPSAAGTQAILSNRSTLCGAAAPAGALPTSLCSTQLLNGAQPTLAATLLQQQALSMALSQPMLPMHSIASASANAATAQTLNLLNAAAGLEGPPIILVPGVSALPPINAKVTIGRE